MLNKFSNQPRTTGLMAMVGGFGVFLYTAFFCALLLLPLVGADTQGTVIERKQAPDVNVEGRQTNTFHDVSVVQYVDAAGKKHTFEADGNLPNTVRVRYLTFLPDTSTIVTESTPLEGAAYGFGAILGFAAGVQGAMWLFKKQNAASAGSLATN
ncbi:MAG: hypothetical protein AABZ78_05880 [Chloroflexota bacterium]